MIAILANGIFLSLSNRGWTTIFSIGCIRENIPPKAPNFNLIVLKSVFRYLSTQVAEVMAWIVVSTVAEPKVILVNRKSRELSSK